MKPQLSRRSLKRLHEIKSFHRKIQKKGKFQMEEYVIILRQYFRDKNITFYEAKRCQNIIKDIRLIYDVVDGDDDDDRLSKIEEIYFYESTGTSKFNMMGSYQPKMDNILDPDLKNDTINSLVEDVRRYFPLIKGNTILLYAGIFVGFPAL